MAETAHQVRPILDKDGNYTQSEVAVRDSSGHKFEDTYQPTLTAGTNITIVTGTISCTYSYTLPSASSSVLGGVKISDTASIVSDNALTTTAGRNYQIQKSSADGTLCVNVPWTDSIVPVATESVAGIVSTAEQWFAGLKHASAWFSKLNTAPAAWEAGALYGSSQVKTFYLGPTSHCSTTFVLPSDGTDANPDTTHTIAVDIVLGTAVSISW